MTILGQSDEKIGSPVTLELPGAQPAGQGSANEPPAPAKTAPSATTAPTYQQPGQSSAPHKPQIAANNRGPTVFPIEGLSPYSNRWTIKARVTQKSDIRHWSNAKGEGKLFNVTLMDESGEIRATGFNTAVDELYDKLVEGKVYFISKARVNLAKKKFSTLTNEYELSLERTTEVEEVCTKPLPGKDPHIDNILQCLDQTNMPTVKYNFTALSELEQIPKDGICGTFPSSRSVLGGHP